MINLTEKAAVKVREIREAEGLGEQGLRVRVIGGGCSGFTYDLFYKGEEALKQYGRLPQPERLRPALNEIGIELK